MAIETTCIGAYPKPPYLRVGNWSESSDDTSDEQEARAFSYVAECIDDPELLDVGQSLLILAAIFGAFDALGIVTMGALRGAGDTRWIMYLAFFGTYFFSLPLAYALAWPVGWGAEGAWIGATIYIIALGAIVFFRFNGERWRELLIFSEDGVRGES